MPTLLTTRVTVTSHSPNNTNNPDNPDKPNNTNNPNTPSNPNNPNNLDNSNVTGPLTDIYWSLEKTDNSSECTY